MNFEELNLDPKIMRAVTEMGFEQASPIQAKSIPIAMEGKDMIGQAQTGTGKTAAFGIPVLQRVDPHKKKLQTIVLCPTRELAIQSANEIRKLSKFMHGVKVLPIYGGQEISKQIRSLKGGVQVVIGTPGRVIDHIRRHTLKLGELETIVLDEADEMLNMGFIDDMEEIMKSIPEERQTLLFSATMPAQIKKLTKKYLKEDSVHIVIARKELTGSTITQNFFEVNNSERFETLCRLIDFDNPSAGIIFCKTKKGVDDLVSSMQSRGYMVEGMHGDMSQIQRMKTLAKFKNGSLKFLVATDVAARGIDVDGVTHVFNYELPQDIESYVHRIGRTGRAGRTGTAYSIISPREFGFLNQIKKVTKSNIVKKSVPTVEEIYNNKFAILLDEVSTIIEGNTDTSRFTKIAEELTEKYNATDVIASLIQNQFKNKLSFDYKNNEIASPKKEDVRLFFSAGKRDGLTIKLLLNYIKDNAKVGGRQIRDIDILENFTFVNVDYSIHKQILEKCSGKKINKRKVNVEVANKNRKRR